MFVCLGIVVSNVYQPMVYFSTMFKPKVVLKTILSSKFSLPYLKIKQIETEFSLKITHKISLDIARSMLVCKGHYFKGPTGPLR